MGQSSSGLSHYHIEYENLFNQTPAKLEARTRTVHSKREQSFPGHFVNQNGSIHFPRETTGGGG
jgi:hypothetical protein